MHLKLLMKPIRLMQRVNQAHKKSVLRGRLARRQTVNLFYVGSNPTARAKERKQCQNQ
jgi:hypothetical protein